MATCLPEAGGILSRRQFLRTFAAAGSIACLAAMPIVAPAAPKASSLAWGDIERLVKQQLATRHGYRAGDLISRSEVETVLQLLEQSGWKVPEKEKLTERVLEDGHYLVRQSRTQAGQKFLRGVAGESLVYDRLDRLIAMPGGQQLVHDIMRLPDGQKLMSKKPTAGFSDLTILLPKQANGKTPHDKNFDKPTGRIYTETDLLKALQESWQKQSGKR